MSARPERAHLSRDRALPTRLPGIEGLRAVAAGSILAFHTWRYGGSDWLMAGPGATVLLNLSLGVTLFFALSGFLLYRPFAAAIARGDRLPSVRSYLRNRALRILPAYWAILVIAGLVLASVNTRDDAGNLVRGALDDPVQLVGAALLVVHYVPDTILVGIGPAWSLAVEVVFYLVLPLLVLGAAAAARRYSERRQRVMVLLAPALLLLIVGLSGKCVVGVVLDGSANGNWQSDWASVVERSFWAQADLFSFGMVAAVAHTEVVDGRLALPRAWRPGALALALAIVVPCAATLDVGQLGYLPQNTAVALAAALLVAAVCFPSGAPRTPLAQRLLESRPFVLIGLVSYSVFLWHEPVIRWLTEHGAMRAGAVGLGWNLAMTAAVVCALATLSYRLVERPALRRKRPPAPSEAPMAASQLEAAP